MFVYDLLVGGTVIVFLISFRIGASPFHYWFLSVSERVDWVRLYLLIT